MARLYASPMGRHRRRRSAAPALAFALPALLLLLLLSLASANAATTPTTLSITSSALLVLDPQPSDPCSRSPNECGAIDSCASALRVDLLSNGTALLTPVGPDYTLSCATSYSPAYASSMYSYDPRVPARGKVEVKCAAMSGRGAEGAWPPAKGGNNKNAKLQPGQRRAIVFDKFADPDLKATGTDGKPYGDSGTVSHSLLSGPDSRTTSSALFNRRAFHSALCYPFYCPTPGCFMGRPSALVVMEVQQKGSGRVLVRSAERQFTCQSWSDDAFCGRELSGFSYRVVEGSLLGEEGGSSTAKSAKADSCPVGTGLGKIVVPAPAAAVDEGVGIKAGTRENVCVSACDGGGNATASSSAIAYSSAPAQCRTCPSGGFLPKGAACAACAGWQGPCCSVATKDCPACGSTAEPPASELPSVRLRLASIVSPRPSVTCTDFFRAAAADLAAATSTGYLDDDAKAKAAADCPPRELTLSVNAACGVELSSKSCPMLNTVRPEYWAGPGRLPEGQLGTLPFNLTSASAASAAASSGGAAAWAIKQGLVTRFWAGRYGEEDGNSTVVALEPNGPGGRGLLALKLRPIGCVFRYAVVEGALPGGGGAPVAAAGAPLPAAAHWCPGSSTKAAEPAKLVSKGESVPVCVVANNKQ